MYKNQVCWTQFNELGFYKLKSSPLDLISLRSSTCPAADRTQNSKQTVSLKTQNFQNKQSLSFPPTLSLSHSHSHSRSLLLLIPPRSISPFRFVSLCRRPFGSIVVPLRRRPSLSLRLSVSFHLCPLSPSLSQEWPSGNDFYPNNRRVSFSFDLFYVVSGFLYYCMNDCLDCLCVLEKWVVVVGFAYLLFLLFFFFFLGVMWIELSVWIGD